MGFPSQSAGGRREEGVTDLQDLGVMHLLIAQRLPKLGLGQGRDIRQQAAFGLIGEGEKSVFRAGPIPRATLGGEHLARQGPRQFGLAQQPGQADRMNPVTSLAMGLEGPQMGMRSGTGPCWVCSRSHETQDGILHDQHVLMWCAWPPAGAWRTADPGYPRQSLRSGPGLRGRWACVGACWAEME